MLTYVKPVARNIARTQNVRCGQSDIYEICNIRKKEVFGWTLSLLF